MNRLHSTRKGLENKSTEIEEDLSPEVMAEMMRRLYIPLKPSRRRNLLTWLTDNIPLLSDFAFSAPALFAFALSVSVLSAFLAVMLLWTTLFQSPSSFAASEPVTMF